MALFLASVGGHFAGGRRYRDHEHHAGLGYGTNARDRPAQGARRARTRHPGAIFDRGDRALSRRRVARHRHRRRSDLFLVSCHRELGTLSRPELDFRSPPVFRPASASPLATGRRCSPHVSIRSKRCDTSKRIRARSLILPSAGICNCRAPCRCCNSARSLSAIRPLRCSTRSICRSMPGNGSVSSAATARARPVSCA